ncbi:MAG: DUF2384 domain-containing protein [Gammaproteobacteria bacterium]|nr:DUF2384 domain-containing protein [Gammaproteobacteria bacterium]
MSSSTTPKKLKRKKASHTSKASASRLEVLADLVDHNEAQREAHFERVLADLEMLDPEIVNHAVSVLGDRHRAARWFATPKRVMPNGESPLRAVARGRRNNVLQALGRIDHGIFS